jgi:threonine dehydratase
VHRSSTLDDRAGGYLYFKCENLQKGGAFKIRGATNAALSLDREALKMGLATHSSGNHAQAVALAARALGLPAYVVMPSNAPRVKVDAVRGYGAQVITCAPSLQSREETLQSVVERTAAAFIHPYDNYDVICGQATCAYEFLQQIPDLDVVIAPVGGGGLLGGTALAASQFRPGTVVFGAEPEGADDAYRSLEAGHIIPSEDPSTIADGLLTSLGVRNFPILRRYVHAILTVSDAEIIGAMRLIWERMKLVVEPSAAVPFAAVLRYQRHFAGKNVGVILSGGNVDLAGLPW